MRNAYSDNNRLSRYILRLIMAIIILISVCVIFSKIVNPKKAPSFFGYKTFVVRTESMNPIVKKGDLAIVKNTSIDSLDVDDVVAFKLNKNYNVLEIIRNIEEKDNDLILTTSSNVKIDKKLNITENQLEGKYLFKIPLLGNLVLFMQSIYGFILEILIVVFVIIYYHLIIKEKDEDKDKIKKTKIKRCNALKKLYINP